MEPLERAELLLAKARRFLLYSGLKDHRVHREKRHSSVLFVHSVHSVVEKNAAIHYSMKN